VARLLLESRRGGLEPGLDRAARKDGYFSGASHGSEKKGEHEYERFLHLETLNFSHDGAHYRLAAYAILETHSEEDLA
jgi:hypothetical protein